MERSLEAWKILKQAQQKYDYFIVGLTTALFAYVAGKYSPVEISLSQNTFELLALIALVASIIAGIFKLEKDLFIQTIIVKKAEAQERLDVANKIINLPGDVLNLDTGANISISDAKNQQEILRAFISSASDGFDKAVKENARLFNIRNVCLLLGFILLIASRIVVLYLQA